MTAAIDPALKAEWRKHGLHTGRTVAQHLCDGAAANPDVEITFWSKAQVVTTTLGDLHREALWMAAALSRRGIQPGDIVGLQVANNYDGVLAIFATWLTGAVVLPIVHIYEAAEVSFILRQARAKALILPDRWGKIDFLQRVGALESLPDLREIIVLGEDAPAGAVLWKDLRPLGRTDFKPPARSGDDLAMLLFTSGSTSVPKGVQHSHDTVLSLLHPSLEPWTPQEVILTSMTVGHIAGLVALMRIHIAGARQIMMDRWDADAGVRLIAEHGVTTNAGVPAMLLDVLDRPRETLASLTSFRVGATNVTPLLLERADAMGFRAFKSYGCTEYPSAARGAASDPIEKRAYTDGRLTIDAEVRILDEEGRDLPVGAQGEIVIRGPARFLGYLDSTLDAEAFLPGGWYRTGDIGRLDADDFITITDRKKDIIIRGGENISSKEVEDLLLQLPDILEVAAVGAPHPRLGEIVCVFARLRPGRSMTLDVIAEHFRKAGIARQKTPERLEIVEEFPRTAAGKIRKPELRERLRQ